MQKRGRLKYRILKGMDKGEVEETGGLDRKVDIHETFFLVNRLQAANRADELYNKETTTRQLYENLAKAGLIEIIDTSVPE